MSYRVEQSGGRWALYLDELCALEHTADAPFATAVRRENICKAVRGSVKEQTVEAERVPLTGAEAGDGAVTFFSGKHRLRAALRERCGGVELGFSGEDGWAYEFRLPAIDGEAVFGGGEQYRQVNLRGKTVVNSVSEHIKISTVIEKALLPRALYREKPRGSIGSYAPMPVFVTDKGRLILFDTTAEGFARFDADEYRFGYDRCPEALLLARGADYRVLSRVLAERIPNRQYLPDWCLDGMILGIQGGTQTMLDKTFAMLDAGAAVCGVWCQDWSGENRTVKNRQVCWNWEVDETLYPQLRHAIAVLNERGVRFLACINPYLVKGGRLYNYCKERGWLILHRHNDDVYNIKSTSFDAGMFDLTNPEAVRYIKDVLIKQNMLDLGVSGWMADFGEYLPVDCKLHGGDPKLLRNEWPVLWAKLNREAIEEYGRDDAFFFMRYGYLGIQKYAPILWNGHQHTDLAKSCSLPCVMPASFSLGFSGAPMVYCGTGGFFSFGKRKRNDELFVRRMEMRAFSLLFITNESILPRANTQFDAEAVKPYTVRLSGVHKALRPYIEQCVREAQSGLPALRPDFYESIQYDTGHDPYSYFLGDDLYVCPVITRRTTKRKVFLPKGVWVHFWTGKVYAGGEAYTVPAPLGEIPVFYRAASGFVPLFREISKRFNLL